MTFLQREFFIRVFGSPIIGPYALCSRQYGLLTPALYSLRLSRTPGLQGRSPRLSRTSEAILLGRTETVE